MMQVRLVHGGDAAAREQAIAGELANRSASETSVESVTQTSAVALLEGLATNNGLSSNDALTVIRIAPGCPCCSGNLTLRVTLNRILRHPPAILYLSLTDGSHLESVQSFLREEQYCGRLELGPALDCGRVPNIRA